MKFRRAEVDVDVLDGRDGGRHREGSDVAVASFFQK